MRIIRLLPVLLLCSCSPKIITVPEIHIAHDTIVKKEVVEKEVIKEVAVHDSVSFLVKGDTIYLYKYRYERDYRYEKALQAKIDSLSHVSRDSVPYPVEVVREVARPLRWWQKALVWWGVVCSAIIAIYLFIQIKKPAL